MGVSQTSVDLPFDCAKAGSFKWVKLYCNHGNFTMLLVVNADVKVVLLDALVRAPGTPAG